MDIVKIEISEMAGAAWVYYSAGFHQIVSIQNAIELSIMFNINLTEI